MLVTQLCLTLCDPVDHSLLAPLSLGFPRQEYWSGLPFPFPVCVKIDRQTDRYGLVTLILRFTLPCMLFIGTKRRKHKKLPQSDTVLKVGSYTHE